MGSGSLEEVLYFEATKHKEKVEFGFNRSVTTLIQSDRYLHFCKANSAIACWAVFIITRTVVHSI